MHNYLRHMMFFCHIIESGSISGAADSLAMSKSVLSQHLKALESALEVKLLQRTTRRQVLTPAGKAFYQSCKAINQIAGQAWQDARKTKEEPIGFIKISAPNAFTQTIIAPVITALTLKHPKISPQLIADDCRLDLLAHEIDLAIRVGELPSSHYRQRRIGSFTDILCASKQFVQQHAAQIAIIDLTTDGLDYIANDWQGKKIEHQLHHRQTGEPLQLKFVATRFANTLQAVLALAEAGTGIALVPDFVFEEAQKNGQLVALLPQYQCQPVPVYTIHAYDTQPPLLIKVCAEAIKDKMSEVTGKLKSNAN